MSGYHPRGPRRSHRTAARNRTTFADIEFGEDDANIEYEISLEKGMRPVFLQAFMDHPQLSLKQLVEGHKYFVLGQKGTGKTAVLRKIQSLATERGDVTSFMIFRDEVASREELDRFGKIFALDLTEVRKIQHHLYTIERLLLLIIASNLPDAEKNAAESEDPASTAQNSEKSSLSNLLHRVLRQPLQRVVEIAVDSLSDAADALSVNVEKTTRGRADIDSTALLRKMNDRLRDTCVKTLKNNSKNVFIFIDEVHFTYRTGHDHDQDASLVRDLIRTVNKLNRIFIQEKVKCKIYAALRSEFLSHPLISAAELHAPLNSYGTEISWATYPANFTHPMFLIGAKRVDASTNSTFGGKDFMKACFANFTDEEAAEFVKSTWSKPRDMVRFLRTCQEKYPDKVTLSKSEYSNVFHASCIRAWKEVETALTSFLTTAGVEKLTKLISSKSSISLEKGNIGPMTDFLKLLAPIAKKETQAGAMNEPETLFKLIYMLGIVYTSRPIEKGVKEIFHSFHRGQENPDWNGNVSIHRGVAKSFS